MDRRLFSLIVLVFTVFTGFSQGNSKQGLILLDDNQYHKARNFFLAQIKATPAESRNYSLLGDTYLYLQLPDSAKAMYQKALELDPKSAFPLIGLGKLAMLKDDRMGKLEFFEKARKADRKNPEVYYEIAKGCFGLSKLDTATGKIYLDQGFELNSKYSPLHIAYGDLESLGHRFGSAVNAYDRAIFFDPTLALAYRKLGMLHTLARSFRDALNSFNKCIEMNSDQVMVYKNLGDLYYLYGKYPDAEKNYEIYISKAEISFDDRERYAIILFFNKKYTEAAKLLEQENTQNSEKSVLLRIRGYIALETGDYAKGLEYMDKFFKLHDPAKNIALDYLYYGRLLQKTGKDTLAIDNYKKALVLDSTKTDIYDDLAKLYSSNKMHNEAAANYLKMIATGADKVNTYFQIGKEYYFEGDTYRAKHDSLMKLQKEQKIPFTDSIAVLDSKRLYFQKADSAFTQVTVLNPLYSGGFYWRGRINAALDPQAENTIAKEAYEKALAVLQTGDTLKNRKLIIECYKYLGFYYFMNGERSDKTDKSQAESFKATSMEYFRKILALDPNDAQSLEVFRRLKIKL